MTLAEITNWIHMNDAAMAIMAMGNQYTALKVCLRAQGRSVTVTGQWDLVEGISAAIEKWKAKA